MKRLRLAFVAGLSDKKLGQKILPLAALDEVESIDLYRRRPFEGPRIRWCPVPADPIRGDVLRLVRLVAGARAYDAIVGCHQRFHGVYAAVAGLLSGRPVIQLAITDVDWLCGNPLVRWALASASAIGVRGTRSRARLLRRGFSRPIEVVANPYRPSAPPAPAAREFDLLSVADFAGYKGHDWMLDVLARVRTERPSIRVALAGRGPLAERLTGPVARRGLAGNVVFLGPLDEPGLARAYASSRALILTSIAEGVPMVAVEAMDAGLPVLATDVGDLRDLVADGVHGRLAPYGDTEAMASAVLDVLADPARTEGLGRAARARLLELAPTFTEEAIQSSWRTLLAGALRSRRR